MHRPFLVLQHIACEPPGAYEDELLAWGGELHRVEVDEGEPVPDWREFAAIVAMGGPMGAYEEERHPWLADEKRLIAEAVRAGTPFWGVCLGGQLLAASLGAQVSAGVAALATEWGDVPAYSRSLEAILGSGALPRLLDEIAAQEAEMVRLARRLFRGWLDRVVAPAGAVAGHAAAGPAAAGHGLPARSADGS